MYATYINTEGGGGGSADGHGAAPVIDEETAHTLQAKLKAATYGSDPLKFFAKFDADKCVLHSYGDSVFYEACNIILVFPCPLSHSHLHHVYISNKSFLCLC